MLELSLIAHLREQLHLLVRQQLSLHIRQLSLGSRGRGRTRRVVRLGGVKLGGVKLGGVKLGGVKLGGGGTGLALGRKSGGGGGGAGTVRGCTIRPDWPGALEGTFALGSLPPTHGTRKESPLRPAMPEGALGT
jgi:hypothetical protein